MVSVVESAPQPMIHNLFGSMQVRLDEFMAVEGTKPAIDKNLAHAVLQLNFHTTVHNERDSSCKLAWNILAVKLV